MVFFLYWCLKGKIIDKYKVALTVTMNYQLMFLGKRNKTCFNDMVVNKDTFK